MKIKVEYPGRGAPRATLLARDGDAPRLSDLSSGLLLAPIATDAVAGTDHGLLVQWDRVMKPVSRSPDAQAE